MQHYVRNMGDMSIWLGLPRSLMLRWEHGTDTQRKSVRVTGSQRIRMHVDPFGDKRSESMQKAGVYGIHYAISDPVNPAEK